LSGWREVAIGFLTAATRGRMQFAARVPLMRILLLFLAAVFLAACATQPNVGVAGHTDGRASEGGLRVGVPF